MKCPFCACSEDKVVDSRDTEEGQAVRRRRECLGCSKRFTTYERIEEVRILVVKKDGTRAPLDRNKIHQGLVKACEKRPVSASDLDSAVVNILQQIKEMGDNEISSDKIGEMVMDRLRELDQVAYIRFASVYREFKDVQEFEDVIRSIKT